MSLILFENRVQWCPVDGWSYFLFLGYSHILTQSCIYMHIYIYINVAILHVTFCHSYTLIFSHWLVVWNILYDFPYIGNFIIPTYFHIFQRGWNHQPVSVSASLSKDWKEVDHQPFAVFPRPGVSVLRSLQIDLEPQITGWYRPTWWFIPRIISGLVPQWFTRDK